MSGKRVPRPFDGAAKLCTVNESKVMVPNVKNQFLRIYVFCKKKYSILQNGL